MVDLEEEKQMFVKVIEGTDVEAMQGYFFDQEMNKEFRAYSNMLLDPSYLLLGEQIQAAWDALSEYQNMVTSSAYKDFQTAIAKAQMSFSNRENGSAAVAKEEIEQLVQAENDYKKNINKAVNHLEVDYTGFLVNPSFEDSRMGWNTTLTSTALKQVSQPAYYAVGADGAKILYNRQGQDNPVSVEISQTVEGLPEGYYKLMASLGSDEDNQMTLFAGDKEVGVSAHPFGEFYLVEAVIEDIHVGADGVLDLGVKAGAWFKADNFRLYYTGNVDSQTNDISDVVVGGSAASDVVAVGGVGVIKLASSSTVSVTVYTTDGRAIRRVTVDGHATVSNLGRGIYIVGNQKVMVK